MSRLSFVLRYYSIGNEIAFRRNEFKKKKKKLLGALNAATLMLKKVDPLKSTWRPKLGMEQRIEEKMKINIIKLLLLNEMTPAGNECGKKARR